ncbi:hypothetical protein [Sphaerisporangium rhizosphaerae]|uniref:ABC transporter permease n=1 Tax=Sphaerisporangium rhizosphaerae TaxID=2269375 RepID=A0ABW2NVM8_9ACTN
MNGESTYTGLGETIGTALRRSAGTRPRRWLLAITLVVGLLAAVGLSMTLPPADRTFATIIEPVQSLMSVTVPFLGVLLAGDLWKAPGTARPLPSLLAATLLAAAVGVFGLVVCALALAVASSGSAADPWLNAGTVTAGSVLVQIVGQLVGTGLGLLVRSPVIACLATLAPMGLWWVLGAVDFLRPAQAFTPYATLRNLLSGHMNPLTWTQWVAVLLIWGVGLNVLGAARLRRSQQPTPRAEYA